MSSVKHVPSKAKEIDRAMVALGFRLAGWRGSGHPYYEHPSAPGRKLTIPGTPRSAGLALKKAVAEARQILEQAGVACP